MSNTDEELLAGVRVKNGEKMTGQFFPLVYDPASKVQPWQP